MHREFLGVSEADTLGDAASLMLRDGADCLVVLRGREPVGCLSPREALDAVLDGSDLQETTVAEVMAPPAPTVEVDESVASAQERLVGEGSSRLVVVENGDAVGVLTERDVLAAGETHVVTAGVGGGNVADPDARASAEELTQAICELCGSLATNLSASNGELVCADCQEV